jgi:hypothetical protein
MVVKMNQDAQIELEKTIFTYWIKQLGTQGSHENFQNMETIQKCFEHVHLYGYKMSKDKPTLIKTLLKNKS